MSKTLTAIVQGGTGANTPAAALAALGAYPASNPAGYTNGVGTLTAVTATSPVVSSGGTAPAISMPPATVSAPGYLTAADWTTFNAKQPALGFTPVNITALGAASGVATLDASGKLTTAQIPNSLVGGLVYQGVWNATTNTPTLTSAIGTKGWYYKVSIAGSTSIDSQAYWQVGDLVIYDGIAWDRVEGGPTEVTSVAGRVGAVVLTASDISGLSGSAAIDTTDANNITSGTLNAARLPAFTGDVTSPLGSSALTLSNTTASPGSYGSSTAAPTFTVDAKGRITASGSITITPSFASLTAKPTTVVGYGITDALTTSSVIGINQGGTGNTTPAGALAALGAYPASNPAGYITTSGALGASNLVTNESVTGVIDGANTAFGIASAPIGLFQLFMNGILQEPGAGNDYTMTGTSITMTPAPPLLSKLRAYYVK